MKTQHGIHIFTSLPVEKTDVVYMFVCIESEVLNPLKFNNFVSQIPKKKLKFLQKKNKVLLCYLCSDGVSQEGFRIGNLTLFEVRWMFHEDHLWYNILSLDSKWTYDS